MKLTNIFITIALTYAIATAIATIGVLAKDVTLSISSATLSKDEPHLQPMSTNFKRVSRFLQQEARNPRAADHCRKDAEICYIQDGATFTCCNNKCVFLATDNHNCGACKKKCKFTQVCCRGECVDVSFDKRHCGACNNPCNPGEYCVYGMCNYA